MSKKILIAYGTRYGATREAAEAMREALGARGSEVNVVDLKQTMPANLSGYDGIIIGSSIQAGQWMGEVKTFLIQNQQLWTAKKLAVYVSSSTAITDAASATDTYITKELDKLGITPAAARAFPGVIDLSPKSRHGWLKKTILSLIAKQQAKSSDGRLKLGEINDFRDWNAIKQFAIDFLSTL
ncbi:MAG TPA: flavodoxin domain-containing protein [bacterium]|nr:flavodoxin domain-containing protein [bacterium]